MKIACIQGVQRPPGRGPVHYRPTQGPEGIRPTPYLPKKYLEQAVLQTLRDDVLTGSHLRQLVSLMAEEMDGSAADGGRRLRRWRRRLGIFGGD